MADVTRCFSGDLSPDQFREMVLIKALPKRE